ncbi:16S rRNA (cytosine(1402)-N(4))-methyltransferase RsmH [Pelistega europaea]|uniref:Ribosomal RNA small subunit methyltransferase H n=1 Tax=Pelistega europaea TaxID=106147 RepID=A0A7Y4P4Z8_9BURK|nr:16S rRNA (cytosine(1402)-N(4))-methyltransferase RsmH [Pelistega europaea]NOL49243.1 16S rRNA (cytosine(1402)-N(4))-methyltransferase RsmH [Pelistega europaea]
MSTAFTHTTVLRYATVNALVSPDFNAKASWIHEPLESVQAKGIYVDGTFGRGGHSRYLLSQLAPDAQLFVIDKDPLAIQEAERLQAEDSRCHVIHGGFSTMKAELSARGITQVQGILLDLGISSPQIDDASRGFSFMRDGPLDMRMDTTRGVTAAEWLATADVEQIKEVIRNYGEERFAFQIAKAIASRRESSPLRTTLELAELVSTVVRTREKGQHPATRTFQAIRIFLNEELEELSRTLSSVLSLLAPQGRMAVISFHSLEDRRVKQFIAGAANPAAELAKLPLRESELPQPLLKNLGKVVATKEEVAANPRARSAILRVAQRTETSL